MTATRDLVIQQGSSFTLAFTMYDDQVDSQGQVVLDSDGMPVQGDPHDFTGFTGRMQIRKSYLTPALVSLGASDITLGADGTVRVFIGASKTDALKDVTGREPAKAISNGIYDLEVVADGDPENVIRLLEGKVLVSANVTRTA